MVAVAVADLAQAGKTPVVPLTPPLSVELAAVAVEPITRSRREEPLSMEPRLVPMGLQTQVVVVVVGLRVTLTALCNLVMTVIVSEPMVARVARG
jgi:hypothetical protein